MWLGASVPPDAPTSWSRPEEGCESAVQEQFDGLGHVLRAETEVAAQHHVAFVRLLGERGGTCGEQAQEQPVAEVGVRPGDDWSSGSRDAAISPARALKPKSPSNR
ncbi:nmrA family protein [Streptomyces laurentii]|uniref:NmrA family protein n=1 Tax=Streptomyces laurentii TaxID=39478 RepID=A0A160NTY9_STRLU|nr:nmrA family protein [Streptomyces laurentii]